MYLSPQQRIALGEPTSHADSHTFRYDPIEANETVKRIAMRIKLAQESSNLPSTGLGEEYCGKFVLSDDEGTSNPGILLSPKRAIGHRKNHERRVNFPPQRPKVGTSADISDETTSGFLNHIFSKMQFACGSTNQVVD